VASCYPTNGAIAGVAGDVITISERHLPPESEEETYSGGYAEWMRGPVILPLLPCGLVEEMRHPLNPGHFQEQTTTTKLPRRSRPRSRDITLVGCVFPCI
jgi:hypothetical protein